MEVLIIVVLVIIILLLQIVLFLKIIQKYEKKSDIENTLLGNQVLTMASLVNKNNITPRRKVDTIDSNINVPNWTSVNKKYGFWRKSAGSPFKHIFFNHKRISLTTLETVNDPNAVQMVNDFYYLIKYFQDYIRKNFNSSDSELLPARVEFVVAYGLTPVKATWGLGAHSDGKTFNLKTKKYQTKRYKVTWTVNLYLTDHEKDFYGGWFRFIDDPKFIIPQKNLMVVFHSGEENVHEITPVLYGKRANFLIMFTDDKRLEKNLDTEEKNYKVKYSRKR